MRCEMKRSGCYKACAEYKTDPGILPDTDEMDCLYRLVLSSDIGYDNMRTILINWQDSINKLYTHSKQFHDAQ